MIRAFSNCFRTNVCPAPFGGSIGDLQPKINSVKIWHTSQTTVTLHASINFTNPTEYSATIPLVDVLLLYNRTALAHLTARDLVVVPGLNSDIRVEASWSPFDSSGGLGVDAGRKLISQYLSGLFSFHCLRLERN